MAGYFYIMASQKNGTLYCGVTSSLIRRTYQHKHGVTQGFTSTYGVKMLVYYEAYDDIRDAIRREKNVKNWQRAWKLEIIEKMNPDWRDLYADIAAPEF